MSVGCRSNVEQKDWRSFPAAVAEVYEYYMHDVASAV
jgi:hypothetical protein